MLRGIDDNEIIAGGYTDKRLGGICPMLAAHRNGGRTSLASFARAWDRFTGARRPRLATARELRALRSYIEVSLLRDEDGDESIAGVARRINRERTAIRPRLRLRRAHGRGAGAFRVTRVRVPQAPSSPGRVAPTRLNTISGMRQLGDIASRKRTPSATSCG